MNKFSANAFSSKGFLPKMKKQKQFKKRKTIFLILILLFTLVLTLIFIISLSQNVEAQTNQRLYGWNSTDWIPVNVDNTGQLSMNANVSSISWNNILDLPSGFSDNIDNTASLNPWLQGTNTLYNDSTNIKIGIGTSSPTHTLNVIGDSNFTQNTTFEQDVMITGTLYGGSPLKISGDINLTNGNIIASDGTIIIANDGTGNLTTSDSLIVDYIYPNSNAVINLENLTISEDLRVTGNSYLGNLVFDSNGTFPDSVVTDYIFSNSASSTTVDNITILKDLRVLGNSYLGSFQIEDDLIIGSNNISSTYVGIGTTSPGAPLHVENSAPTTAYFIRPSAGPAVRIGESTSQHGVLSWTASTDVFSLGTDAAINAININDAGNVGIGTTSPSHTLNVQGDLNVTGDAFLGSFTLQDDLIIGSNNISSTNVGIGTTSPKRELEIFTSGNGGLRISSQTANFYAGLQARGGSGTIDWDIVTKDEGTPETTFLSFDSSTGNVGIGTTTPTSPLHVIGDVNASGDIHLDSTKSYYFSTYGRLWDQGSYLTLTDFDNNARLQFAKAGADSANNYYDIGTGGIGAHIFRGSGGTPVIMKMEHGGNVGIGTTSPGAKLDILETTTGVGININRSAGTAGNAIIKFQTAGADDWILGERNDGTSDFRIYNYGTSTDSFSILRANGNVGIGTTSPTYKLDVYGGGINVTGITDNIVFLASAAQSGYTFKYSDLSNQGQLQLDSNGGNIDLFNINQNNGAATGALLSLHHENTAENHIETSGTNEDLRIEADGTGDIFLNPTSGNVGIGTTSPTHALNVVGDVNITGDLWVQGQNTTVPDYVFESYYGKEISVPEAQGYKLASISALAQYTKTNNQLPPSIVQGNFTTNGGSNNLIQQQYFLLEKIEEQAIYTIQQQIIIEELKQQNKAIKTRLETLENKNTAS